jgi:hypothetical protein
MAAQLAGAWLLSLMGRAGRWHKRYWTTEVVVASLEMLSGRSKKEYAREPKAVAGSAPGWTAPEACVAARRRRTRWS